MDKIKSYRDLDVWRKAMDLVEACYREVGKLPKNERFGLTNQIQRAVVSVPANIAEGHGRGKKGEYLRYLSIAHGSLMELETHLEICSRLEFLDKKTVKELLKQTSEIGRMLQGLMRSLRK